MSAPAQQTGKIALITGGNKGIGLETARQLAQQGFTVLIGCRDENKGQAAVQTLQAEGLTAQALALDMENPQTFVTAAQWIEQKYGKLDVLVNNAGIQTEAPDWNSNTTLELPMETLRQTFEVNFFGLIELTQKLLPLLQKSESGRIVNVSSIMASLTLHSNPKSPIYKNKPFAYDASKTAINQFTVHLAQALRHTPIKVNAAHPGWVKTDLGSEKAPMQVADGAQTSVWLATLPADGPSGGFFHKQDVLPW